MTPATSTAKCNDTGANPQRHSNADRIRDLVSLIANLARLARAGLTFIQYGVDLAPKRLSVPPVLRLARALTWPLRVLTWPFRAATPRERRAAAALTRLGPSYVKLGQFLATRPDVVGIEAARDLGHLQDRMPPFPQGQAVAAIEEALGAPIGDLYADIGPAVAAASIAQVHKASLRDETGTRRSVAVKVLRPGIERRFARDLDSYRLAAQLIERWHAPSRRLKPTAVVETLRATTELEMDLRLEAAAISEMAGNIAGDRTLDDGRFRVPEVDWRRTQRRVLTLEWVDGIGIANVEQLRAAGHDLARLGTTLLRSFLRHAMRDGFFHADMHPGNLLVEPDGTIVALDFGIMGRLGARERRFLAEILHGLITRDYARAAEVHFWAGYVPAHHPVATFAQALRAIGEPIHGRAASEISMADLLGQLFAYTEVFDMETRPELINLQKTMVVVEGVARSLDPSLNLWAAAEPIARDWVESNLGAAGALKDAREGAGEIGRLLAAAPAMLGQAERSLATVANMADTGVKLSPQALAALASANARSSRLERVAVWLGALALVAIALALWLGPHFRMPT